MTKPIRVWLTPSGPNPWKVVVVLEELGVPYEIVSFRFEEVKSRPFIDINPNGRVPAIEDPNTELTLWESGAIVQYLIEQYDTNHLLSYEGLKERHLTNQWLHFQMSGQGPYFGQASWFLILHTEKVPSAINRYVAELKRVLGVLDRSLEGKQWLVGDKMTFADLAFLPWNSRVDTVLSCSFEEAFEGMPNAKAWHDRMMELPSWKRCMAKKEQCMAEQGLNYLGTPAGHESTAQYVDSVVKAQNSQGKIETKD